ncbi:uncharacterized protein LOC142324585 [Lycorma delicatula]|uniref:uncharacterized protein LOC142324585 n=1 Tax=Lycorma delicatula TaxID=130591 RepID=UPI003F5160E4
MDAMSKKEKLARGSAVIKVMRVNPRPGRFLKGYIDPRKIPKAPPKPNAAKGMAAEMPHLDLKNAVYTFQPSSAKINVENPFGVDCVEDPCNIPIYDDDDVMAGLPDGDKLLTWFGYREWARSINPPQDGNLAEHFNILLGLLMSMAVDKENENFPDVEAYPCVQFLRTIVTPDGDVPYNIGCLIAYLEYIAMRILEES